LYFGTDDWENVHAEKALPRNNQLHPGFTHLVFTRLDGHGWRVPRQDAGKKTRKTPRPYGVAKGMRGGQRAEQQNRKSIYGFVVASSVSPYNLGSVLRKFSRDLRSGLR
jgi:hypothetical protein